MVANRGHEIVPEALWAKTQHCDHFCEKPIWPPRKIGIARICASHMRAEGAADTFRISIVGEPILSNLIRISVRCQGSDLAESAPEDRPPSCGRPSPPQASQPLQDRHRLARRRIARSVERLACKSRITRYVPFRPTSLFSGASSAGSNPALEVSASTNGRSVYLPYSLRYPRRNSPSATMLP